MSWNVAGGSTATGTVTDALIGIHAPRPSDLRFHWLKARLTSLTEWIGAPAFDLFGAHGTGGTISYQPTKLEVIANVAGKRFGVFEDVGGLPERSGTQKSTSVALSQQSWVYVVERRGSRRDYDELQSDLGRFAGFLSFVAGRDCPFLEMVGEATVPSEHGLGRERRQVSVLFHRTVGGTTPTDSRFMLFTYQGAKSLSFRPVARWFRRAPLLEPIYNLYLSAIPTQSPKLEFRFLALAQALDAYYFRRVSTAKLDYVKIVRALQEQMPATIRRRIPSHFAPLVKDTRHYFTHWNPKYEQRAAKGADLIAVTLGAKLMLECLLLRELGLSKTQIAAVVEHNLRVAGQFQRSFDQL